jgi:hypothetical protein
VRDKEGIKEVVIKEGKDSEYYILIRRGTVFASALWRY